MDLNTNNTLRNSSDYVNINMLDIDDLIMLKKKQKYLDMHPYSIWQSKDGRYWYTTLPDKTKPRGVRQIRRNSEEEMQASIIEYWEEHSHQTSIEEVFTDWNDDKLQLKKIGELTHLRNIQLFNKHFKSISAKSIEEINPDDLAEFLENQLVEFSLTSKAFSNIKTLVRGMVKFARKKGLITFTDYDVFGLLDVADRAFKKVIKEDDEEVFNDVETPIILNYLQRNLDIRNIGIILMFVTGVRVGELVALKHKDFVDNTVRIRRMEVRIPNPDGGSRYEIKDFPKSEAGIRDIIVPESYQWIIDKLQRGNPENYVFVNYENIRLTTNSIRKRLWYVCDKLGFKHKSPHKVRKTYGSILLDNNLDARFVQEQMGHADIRCTEKHYHLNRRTKKEKSEIINKIPDFQGGDGSASET